MMTVLLTVAAVVLVAVLVIMFIQVCRGCLCATIWWFFGGMAQTAELLVAVLAGLFEAVAGSSR